MQNQTTKKRHSPEVPVYKYQLIKTGNLIFLDLTALSEALKEVDDKLFTEIVRKYLVNYRQSGN